MTNRAYHPPCFPRQHGVALITGLIFMVVLTLIGITAARMAGLEERMSGNMRDRSLATQAAEMALRDAERDIVGGAGITRPNPINIGGLTLFDPGCTDGLCDAINAPPQWSVINMTAAPSIPYGRFTGATNNLGLSALPRYIIEGLPQKLDPDGVTLNNYYRITVRAQGANPNTVVWLQAIYQPLL